MANSHAGGRAFGTPHRTAIIVVHGVGDNKAGDTVDYVVDEVVPRSEGLVASSYSRVRWLPEPPGILAQNNEEFPVHERDLRLGDGTEATAYELFWADLTRLRGNGIVAGIGLLRAIFETPHVVDALLRDRPGVLSRILRYLLLAATCFIRGPLAGFAATMFAGGLIFLTYAFIPEREPINGALSYIGLPITIPYWLPYQLYFMATLLAFGLGGFWIYSKYRTRDVGWADVGLFAGLSSVFVIIDLLARTHLFQQLNAIFYGGTSVLEPIDWTHSSQAYLAAFKLYYPLLTPIWMVWAGMLSAAIAIYFVMFLTEPKGRKDGPRGAGAAIALAVVQASGWLATVPVLAVVQIDGIRAGFSSQFDRQMYEAMQSVSRLGKEAIPASDWILAEYKASVYGLDSIITRALRELSASFLWNASILMVLLVIGGAIVIYRNWAVGRASRGGGRSKQEAAAGTAADWAAVSSALPRLIVDARVIIFLIFIGVVQAYFIFARFSEADDRLPEILVPIGIAVAGALLLLARSAWSWFSSAVGGVLHIAQDLIDHHYRTGIGFSGHFSRLSTRSHVNRLPRRERIAARLTKLVRTLIEGKGFDDVLFLAHSQGSVIVFDYLKDAHKEGGMLGRYRPYVLTVGSPLGHLYRHYFDDYRTLDGQLDALRPEISRWVNIYRADDPIGGEVKGTSPAFPQNIAMAPGGHLGYWQEIEVVDTINELLNEAARSQTRKPPV